MATDTKRKECTCLADIAEKIKAHIISDQAKKQKGYELIEGEWEHSTFYPKVRIYSNFIIKSTFEKKDGTRSRPQNSHLAIHYGFCPFCGDEFIKDTKF